MKFASIYGSCRNKMISWALFFSIISTNVLAQSLPADRGVSTNPLLVSEIRKYEAYIIQLSAKYKIGDHIITILHKKDNQNDVYQLNIIAYRFEVKQFNPSSWLVIDKIPVLINDRPDNQPKVNKQLIKYVLNNFLQDDITSGWIPDSELYKYPQFTDKRLPDSIVINGQKEHLKVGYYNSGRLKYVNVIPKRWNLVFNNNILTSKIEDKSELLTQ